MSSRHDCAVETDTDGQVIGLVAKRLAALSDAEVSRLSVFPRLERVHLARAEHLEKLYLGGTKVGDTWVASLTNRANLVELDLRGSEVTDAGLVHLAEVKSLRHLDLVDTKVSAPGVARLRKLLPLCTIASQHP